MTAVPTLAPGTAGPTSCCAEYAAVSRRGLLGGLAAVGAATMIGGAVVSAGPAAAASASSVMVVLSLRGAADGLSMVVPYTDPTYYAARPRIGIPADRLILKDGTFGFHPAMAALAPLWNQGRLATVQGTGLPAPNRSHFSAMEEVEDADPGSDVRSGWLNRLVGALPGGSPLQGFGLGGGVVPTSLVGPAQVMAGSDVDAVGFAGVDEWDHGGRLAALHRLWDGRTDSLGRAMASAFDSVSDFAPAQKTANNKARYPDTDLGRALSEVARIIRADVGVGVITVDQGDWDMHSQLGTVEWGRMIGNAKELAEAMAAFFGDLGSQASKVTMVAFSEFGRRVVENANYGLDHGFGNLMLLAGAGVKGGRHHGTLQPLTKTDDADVPVTTDYRSVLSEVVTTRFGVSRASVFPGFTPETVGVMA